MGKLFTILQRVLHPILPVKKAVFAEPVGEEPCVFLVNHIGAMGPIYMAATFPLRDKALIWCNHEVMDEKETVAYVRRDWWWDPQSRLAPLLNATLPHIAAAVVPKVMRSAPTIPVYHDARSMSTIRQSLKALRAGKHIVIFPELPDGYDSHAEELQMGWLNLCTLYQRTTGKPLRMMPIHIDAKVKEFRVGRAITLASDVPLAEQEHRVERYLAAGLRGKIDHSA